MRGPRTPSWAGRSGMSGPSVAERIARLEQAGVITGYHAAVDPAALGLSVAAIVGVHLSDTSDQDAVTTALSDLEEVEDCWFVAGDESFLIKVRVAGMPELEATLSRLRRITRGVAHPHDRRALDQVGEPRRRRSEL